MTSEAVCCGVMRTTLTLDADVAAEIDRRRREHDHTLREEVNHLLRLGLHHDRQPRERGEGYRTATFSVGRVLVEDLDDVAEALAIGEGEDFR